uniref:Uncharacterized protein n=1 Tax=Anguilla anguilla TaxID=7936 RepID=A0A0E9TRS7_ANGAN
MRVLDHYNKTQPEHTGSFIVLNCAALRINHKCNSTNITSTPLMRKVLNMNMLCVPWNYAQPTFFMIRKTKMFRKHLNAKLKIFFSSSSFRAQNEHD